MAAGKLKIDIRRKKILNLLQSDGQVSVSELSQLLDATTVTIRSDLSALERDGLLRRMRGGAILDTRTQLNWQNSMRSDDPLASIKQSLAEKAIEQLQDGSTVFINSGSTMRHLAATLKQCRNLNIVTNFIPIAIELGQMPTFRVLLLGGEINTQYAFTCGGDAQSQLLRYQADWAILSVDGIDSNEGITTYHADEAIINRTMIDRANRTMIVADHSKIGQVGFTNICPAETVQVLVTDQHSSAIALASLEELGIEIIIA